MVRSIMPSSPGYKRNYKLQPVTIKKDGRAGRRIKKVYNKICKNCGNSFTGIKKQVYCSESCKGEYPYKTGKISTIHQYEYISGNWERYFGRLCNKKGRELISAKDCLDLLEKQNGKCALSGVNLTCQLEVGKKFFTNASLDRIEVGGGYTKDNVQLVCSALNSWRGDVPLEEYVWWCKQVTICQEKEGS